MVAELWPDPAGALTNFANAIGLKPEALDFAEGPDALDYEATEFQSDKLKLPVDPAARAELLETLNKAFQEMLTKYDSALTLRFRLGPEELIVQPATTTADIESFLEIVEDTPFEVHLQIGKARLAEKWGFTHPLTSFKLFLFPRALNRALSVSLAKLEDEKGLMGGFSGERKLMILAPDHRGIEMNGDYLTILGGAAILRWRDYLPAASDIDQIQQIHEQLRTKPMWTGIPLRYVTPLHLYIDSRNPPAVAGSDELIAQKLGGQLLACSLLYMATNSISADGQNLGRPEAANPGDYPWLFTFAQESFSARIEIPDTEAIEQALAANQDVDVWDSCKRIGGLAKWIYEEGHGIPQRLGVIQLVIASSLQDNAASANLGELIRNALELSGRVRQRWDDFMDDKLSKYFLHLKELDETVRSTTNAHSERIQTLTKALSDNMLAAVGVVVGSFIAAIFKSPFENYIFWIGIGIYLAYLIAFPICVGMVTAWQRFSDSREAFDKTEREFGARLSAQEVADIVGTTVEVSEGRFRKWFVFTGFAYAAVVLLLLWGMWTLPTKIKSWSDKFELSDLSYSQPATSELVPLIIRGDRFDKDKEIVVTIGDSAFTNTDGQTLKVLGSTILTLNARQQDLANAKAGGGAFVSVKQGTAEPKRLPLPHDPAPIPKPKFEKWIAGQNNNGVEVYGSSFDSILQVTYRGNKVDLTPSADPRRFTLSDTVVLKEPWNGRVLELTLKNGVKVNELVTLTMESNRKR
jgi:hypothetical protein